MSRTKHILIRSKDRITGDTNDFKVYLPSALQGVKGFSLLSLHLPNVMYNVNSSNNTLDFNDGSAVTATMPVGAYNINTLLVELKTQMDAVGSQAYTVSYNQTTMKITISATNPFTLDLSPLSYILGFDAASASATSHTSDMVIRLDYPSYLFIEIKEFNYGFTTSTSGVIANFVVCMTGNSQSLEVFNRNVTYNLNECYSSNQNLTNLSIRVRKDDGSLADLQNSDWSLLLGILYD